MAMQGSSASNAIHRDRLPSLGEVLTRRTKPPVDLFCFYLFLRREQSEDTLDFWLDVHQHESLCRAYFKDLRKSGRDIQDEWPEYYREARNRGSIYNRWTGIQRMTEAERDALAARGTGSDGYGDEDEDEDEDLKGRRYRQGHDAAEEDDYGPDEEKRAAQQSYGGGGGYGYGQPHSGLDPYGHDPAARQSRPSLGVEPTDERYTMRTPSPSGQRPLDPRIVSPTLRALYPHDDDDADPKRRRGAGARSPSLIGRHSRRSAHSSNGPSEHGAIGGGTFNTRRHGEIDPVISRTSAITRTDLLASAERIYARYLLPGAPKEIYLPPALRIHSFPLSALSLPRGPGEDGELERGFMGKIPDIYHLQKEYIYRSLEAHAFPRFLRAKAFGNLTPLSALVRLGTGLACLWVALTTALSLIFLGVDERTRRLWIIIPFIIAIFLVLSHSYDLDALLVFANRSETTPFHTIGIKEPYVRKLLLGRAIWVTLLTLAVTAVVVVVFVFIPSRRL